MTPHRDLRHKEYWKDKKCFKCEKPCHPGHIARKMMTTTTIAVNHVEAKQEEGLRKKFRRKRTV
jgi:hypothetical protein